MARISWQRTLATPGALKLLERHGKAPTEYIARVLAGDWGDLTPADKRANDSSLKDGSRLLCSYNLTEHRKDRLWIIVEAEDDDKQRAALTLLLPDEY